MKQIKLTSSNRTEIGGKSAKRYRKNGQIPAVIYGESGEKNLIIDEKELNSVLKSVLGKAVLIEMDFADGTDSRFAMIKDVVREPLSDKVEHVDFIEVVRGKPMHAVAPLRVSGEAYGVKNENGIVEVHTHEVKIICRPRDLPESINIDISDLKVGEFVHLKDIKAPEGVEFNEELETLLVSCSAIKVAEEPVAAAPAADAAAPAAAAETK